MRDAVRKIRNSYFAGSALQDVIDATEVHRRKIVAIGIARTVLHRAGDADHTFHARVIRIDLRIRDRPILIKPVSGGGFEINVAEAR